MRLLLALLAVVFTMSSAAAEPFLPGSTLDRALVADVTATALGFIAPRTLEAVPMAQLTVWGLRGLASLDPRLSAELEADGLRLTIVAVPAPKLLLMRASPRDQDAAAWGEVAADMVRAAWDRSEQVRRAGTDGVLEAFFDEICNHLDPYSRYATPAEALADRQERDGQAGPGLRTAWWRGAWRVTKVLPGSPAFLAGLRGGEALLAVDDAPVAGLGPATLDVRLAGAEGSEVRLSVRDRAGRIRVVSLRRTQTVQPTVHLATVGGMAMLTVDEFSSDTGALMSAAVARLQSAKQPPSGLVIDLRSNPGGLLRESVAVAETLLDHGVVAVTTGRDPAANQEFRVAGGEPVLTLPLVVLVDGSTASAAEVLAASLADQRRGVVVGSATLGKGLVQAVAPLPNGGELLLTWSRVLAPLGWPIQGSGVLPQVCTSRGPLFTQHQLSALDRGEFPLRDAVLRERATRPPLGTDAALTLRTACPAADGTPEDLVAARFLLDHPDVYAAALIGPPP